MKKKTVLTASLPSMLFHSNVIVGLFGGIYIQSMIAFLGSSNPIHSYHYKGDYPGEVQQHRRVCCGILNTTEGGNCCALQYINLRVVTGRYDEKRRQFASSAMGAVSCAANVATRDRSSASGTGDLRRFALVVRTILTARRYLHTPFSLLSLPPSPSLSLSCSCPPLLLSLDVGQSCVGLAQVCV